MMTKTYSTRSCMVGTVKKSTETIWPTLFRRNVIQVCDGFPVFLGIKRDTVRSEILNPSFFSSPWTRGAPHVGLAVTMVWMSFRISEPVRGRPRCFLWDNFRQYRLNRSRCQEVTVSGFTNIKADFQSCQIMYRPIQNHRSRLFSFGRGTLCLKTASCCRRAAFSKA